MKNFTRVQQYYLSTLSEEDRNFILATVASIVKEGFNNADGVKKLNLKNLLPPTAVEEARAVGEARTYAQMEHDFQDWRKNLGL